MNVTIFSCSEHHVSSVLLSILWSLGNVLTGIQFIQLFLTVLPDIKVEVSKKNSKDFAICKVVKQPLLHNETRRITCLPGVTGSIVRITSTATKALCLSLSDVKVYGTYGKLLIYLYYTYLLKKHVKI